MISGVLCLLLSLSGPNATPLLSILSCDKAGLGLLLDVFLSVAPRLPKLCLGVDTVGLLVVAFVISIFGADNCLVLNVGS